MDIKPIETYYNGYRFRSRLEARWAVFFDAMGIKYEYEPEGFTMSDGTMYLPDFYLPESGQFFEVKGVMTDTDLHKVQQFVSDADKCVTIGYSDFHFETCNFWGWKESEDDTFKQFSFDKNDEAWLCKCNYCGKYWFQATTGGWHCQSCGKYDGDHHFSVELYSMNGNGEQRVSAYSEKAFDALIAARRARFEHGETPQAKEVIAPC